jgi:hypothetical protein
VCGERVGFVATLRIKQLFSLQVFSTPKQSLRLPVIRQANRWAANKKIKEELPWVIL